MQRHLVDALRHVGSPPPLDRLAFIRSDRFDRAYRLAVYKDGANRKYAAELKSTYPRTFSFFEDTLVVAMCEAFSNRYPSHAQRPIDTLTRFPRFLARQAVGERHPQLVELARFEREEAVAWYRKDVPLPTRRPPALSGLVLHPRVRFVVAQYRLYDARRKSVLVNDGRPVTPPRQLQVITIQHAAGVHRVGCLSTAELRYLAGHANLPAAVRSLATGPAINRARAGRIRSELVRRGLLVHADIADSA